MPVEYGFKADDVVRGGKVTREQIENVCEWSRSQEDVPALTEEQVVNFVLSCDGDLEFSKSVIKVFYKERRNTPELFTGRDVAKDDLQLQLRTMDYIEIPRRTEDGCAIIYNKLHDYTYSNYHMEPAFKLLFMTLDSALYKNPPSGLIILFDIKGVGFKHLSRIRINLMRVLCRYLQDGLPVKLKAIHVFNSEFFTGNILFLLRPFLQKNLYDKLHFYSADVDMEAFYRNGIPKCCLPADYGGDLPDIKTLHEQNTRNLAELKRFFDAEEQQRKTT